MEILIYLLIYVTSAVPSFFLLWYLFRLTAYFQNDLFNRWGMSNPLYYLVRALQWLVILPIGIVVDIGFNQLYGSVWFRQSPLYAFRKNRWFDTTLIKRIFNPLNRLTLTGRLKYNKLYYDVGERKYDLAIYLCREWVEPYDHGHCHNNEW